MDDDYRVRNGDIVEIKERLASIETAIMFIKGAIAAAPKPGEATVCVFEKERIEILEAEQRKSRRLSIIIGSIVGGSILVTKLVPLWA